MNTFKCLLAVGTVHTSLVLINSKLNYFVEGNSLLKEGHSEWCFSVPTWPQIIRMPFTSISTSKQSCYFLGYTDCLFANTTILNPTKRILHHTQRYKMFCHNNEEAKALPSPAIFHCDVAGDQTWLNGVNEWYTGLHNVSVYLFKRFGRCGETGKSCDVLCFSR
jgi:hypothetical protein